MTDVLVEEKDGVIQFQAIHEQWQSSEITCIRFCEKYAKEISKLQEIRQVLRDFDWIGRDVHRYQNTGFGNLSARISEGFLISPSQSSHLERLTDDAYTWVKKSDIHQNRVYSIGHALPSSESMTHAMIYRLCPEIDFVLHGHVPHLWQKSLIATDPKVGYGTIEMANEIKRLFDQGMLKPYQIFKMSGHLDGVLLFGNDIQKLIQTVHQSIDSIDLVEI